MVKEISLNRTLIHVNDYKEESVNGKHKVWITFKVTSEDYHEITTLLYEGTFDVAVPATGLSFRGSIEQYSTSIANLYEKGQVGEFTLSLVESKKEGV
ncbi:DUF3219 family protein [Bacillus sp. FJAT-29814]|uniref:DUF3219 family protein n=1 Tax=Bacillus sp. FJAT-29814 TaxID=1729688 RepID=UPI000831A992|nr:DUF3219 family protein [Bacillus sp. FJAT-29814]